MRRAERHREHSFTKANKVYIIVYKLPFWIHVLTYIQLYKWKYFPVVAVSFWLSPFFFFQIFYNFIQFIVFMEIGFISGISLWRDRNWKRLYIFTNSRKYFFPPFYINPSQRWQMVANWLNCNVQHYAASGVLPWELPSHLQMKSMSIWEESVLQVGKEALRKTAHLLQREIWQFFLAREKGM